MKTSFPEAEPDFDVVVVGAGLAGLYALYRFRAMGLSVRVLESGDDVGGTWYWNRYPGARCDVESMEYSYQFSEELQQDWTWTERYATQPEILRYVNHVVDRFDLRRDIEFETRVVSAAFDSDPAGWRITTTRGGLRCRFLILATGCLSAATTPDFEGLDSFAGGLYRTARWPHEGVDFSGRRVGIIGTGSSAIQSIPILAREAGHLFVFQRTANYSVPAWNQPLDDSVVQGIKADYGKFRAENKLMPSGFGARYPGNGDRAALAADREEREAVFASRWERGGLTFLGAFNDLLIDFEANDLAGEFIRSQILQKVEDPETARLLLPDYPVGCKRLCVDTDYYETFNRDNVTLVDVRDTPIERITSGGVVVGERTYPLDDLILATGFDAMTGAILGIDIRGRGGTPLRDQWKDGPLAYLGLQVSGFPNLFMITGPGSPSVLTNMLPSIEQHVEFISSCVGFMDERGLSSIEASREAQDEWVQHVGEVGGATILRGCNSWYVGANIPGKPRVFMPYLGFPNYVARCEEVVARGYEGFILS